MNTIGRLLKISIYGESHGAEVGVLVDGVPAGIALKETDFEEDLLRRKAGRLGTTKRLEADTINIKSGVFNGYTTGGAILLSFENHNQNSKDYSNLVDHPRPSHADFVANVKYDGYQDYRGGGTFSGRLTLGLVAAGVIAKKIISTISFSTEIINLGGTTDKNEFENVLTKALEAGDSVGGIVEIKAKGAEIGLGEPYFDSLESTISHLLFAVGGVKGVSFGTGFEGVNLTGKSFNDVILRADGTTKSNHSGGINGGISNGNDIVVKVFVKPTSSIFMPQATYSFKSQRVEELKIDGRHDTAIILRTCPVLEACVAIALADAYLIRKSYKKQKG